MNLKLTLKQILILMVKLNGKLSLVKNLMVFNMESKKIMK